MTDTEASQRRSVYIPDQMWRKLRMAAIEHNTNVSELIREAIAGMTPWPGPNTPEFVKRRVTGTHHHLEKTNAEVQAESPKSSESVSPELQECFAKTAELLAQLTKPGLLHKYADTPEFEAWARSQKESQ